MASNTAASSGHVAARPEVSTRPPFRVRVEQSRTFLRTTYPALFNSANPPPLKVGIHRDLLERHPELDVPGLKRALTLHCRSPRYQRKLVAGAARVDLDGNPDGSVTAEQAARALEMLEARQKPTQRPEPVVSPPPEPPPPPSDALGRPTLRLKKKPSSSVVVATVVRKGAKP